MDLEVFVRASGSAMGLARDSFGLNVDVGGGLTSTLGPSATLTGPVSGSGQAVLASNSESNAIDAQVSALGSQNLATNAHLDGTLTAAGAGRSQMEAVIEAALADINSLAATTTSLTGQLALVQALVARLEQTWQTLTNGNTDASTRTASSGRLAAAYNGLGNGSLGGVTQTSPAAFAGATSPMGAMSSMPMLAAASMASNAAASSAQAANTQQAASNSGVQQATLLSDVTPTGPGRPNPVPIWKSTVLKNINNGIPVSTGRGAFINYANQVLTNMGITDSTARNMWLSGSTKGPGAFPKTPTNPYGDGGLLLGAYRESSFNPLAVNTTDSNANGPFQNVNNPPSQYNTDGHPQNCSRGLMQFIPGTFAANYQAGTKYNIYDPYASISAAINYLHGNYHVEWSGQNLAAVTQFNPYSGGGGY